MQRGDLIRLRDALLSPTIKPSLFAGLRMMSKRLPRGMNAVLRWNALTISVWATYTRHILSRSIAISGLVLEFCGHNRMR